MTPNDGMAVGIIGLVTLQAGLGLLLQGEYRYVPWIAVSDPRCRSGGLSFDQ